jgi:hypothetical protein
MTSESGGWTDVRRRPGPAYYGDRGRLPRLVEAMARLADLEPAEVFASPEFGRSLRAFSEVVRRRTAEGAALHDPGEEQPPAAQPQREGHEGSPQLSLVRLGGT